MHPMWGILSIRDGGRATGGGELIVITIIVDTTNCFKY